MTEEKIKIIEATYDLKKDLAKIKVEKIDGGKEITWALTGDSFDSLVGQITGIALSYYPPQRNLLCTKIVGLEILNQIEVDIENADVENVKERSETDFKHGLDVVDMYPFYELQEEVIENIPEPQETDE
jgi:hypothetical protein